MTDETQYPMVRKWADHRDDRIAVETFVLYLQEEARKENATVGEVLDRYQLSSLLDRAHGIDQGQLERERRAIIDAFLNKSS